MFSLRCKNSSTRERASEIHSQKRRMPASSICSIRRLTVNLAFPLTSGAALSHPPPWPDLHTRNTRDAHRHSLFSPPCFTQVKGEGEHAVRMLPDTATRAMAELTHMLLNTENTDGDTGVPATDGHVMAGDSDTPTARGRSHRDIDEIINAALPPADGDDRAHPVVHVASSTGQVCDEQATDADAAQNAHSAAAVARHYRALTEAALRSAGLMPTGPTVLDRADALRCPSMTGEMVSGDDTLSHGQSDWPVRSPGGSAPGDGMLLGDRAHTPSSRVHVTESLGLAKPVAGHEPASPEQATALLGRIATSPRQTVPSPIREVSALGDMPTANEHMSASPGHVSAEDQLLIARIVAKHMNGPPPPSPEKLTAPFAENVTGSLRSLAVAGMGGATDLPYKLGSHTETTSTAATADDATGSLFSLPDTRIGTVRDLSYQLGSHTETGDRLMSQTAPSDIGTLFNQYPGAVPTHSATTLPLSSLPLTSLSGGRVLDAPHALQGWSLAAAVAAERAEIRRTIQRLAMNDHLDSSTPAWTTDGMSTNWSSLFSLPDTATPPALPTTHAATRSQTRSHASPARPSKTRVHSPGVVDTQDGDHTRTSEQRRSRLGTTDANDRRRDYPRPWRANMSPHPRENDRGRIVSVVAQSVSTTHRRGGDVSATAISASSVGMQRLHTNAPREAASAARPAVTLPSLNTAPLHARSAAAPGFLASLISSDDTTTQANALPPRTTRHQIPAAATEQVLRFVTGKCVLCSP